jgi:phage gp29-like protein
VVNAELATLVKRAISRYNFGYAHILPNPDIKAIAPAKLRTLLKDSHLTAVVGQRKAGCLKLALRFKPGRNRTDDSHLAIQEMLAPIDLRAVIDDATDAPLYGRQTFEVLWDGRYLPVAVVGKPPECFGYDDNDLLCRREDPSSSLSRLIPLEPRNFITVWHRRKWGVNDGEALLEKCFWPLVFKRQGAKWWAQFMEKYAIPWVIAKYRPGTSDDQIAAIQEAVDNMIQAATAVIPEDGNIEIVEAAAKADSSGIFERNLAFQNAEISKVILGSTLTVEQGESGAYSLGKVHQEVRQDIIDSDREICLKVLNTLAAWVDELHFGRTDDHPTAELYDPAAEKESESKQQETLSKRDETLNRIGVRFTKKYFMERYGLSEEEFELGVVAAPPGGAQFAEEPPANPADQPPSVKTLDDQIEPIMRPVVDALRKSKDYDAARKAIKKAIPAIDTADMEDMLTRAIFIAEMLGRNDAAG